MLRQRRRAKRSRRRCKDVETRRENELKKWKEKQEWSIELERGEKIFRG